MPPALWECIQKHYNHVQHARRAHCAVCHPKAVLSTRAEDVLYPNRRHFCAVCHGNDPCEDGSPPGEGPPASPPTEGAPAQGEPDAHVRD